ncbi:MAG: hypothetical protein ACRC0L_11255, partial [Angustibacter sp.]
AAVFVGGCVNFMKESAESYSREYLKTQTNCEIESIALTENNSKARITQRPCKGLNPEDRTATLDYEQGRWVMGSSS